MCERALLCFLLLCFATQADAQSLVSTSPTRHDEDAARATNITATFSTNMQGAGPSTFRVFGGQSGVRAGAYGGAGTTTLSFNPAVDFNAGERVEVSFTSGLVSTGSAPLTNPQVMQFRAAAAPSGGEFRNYVQALGGAGGVFALRFGDMDGDGDLDAVTSADTGQVAIFINNAGVFGTTPNNFGPTFAYTSALELGDMDADGDLDVVVRNGSSQVLIYFNSSGALTAGTPFGAIAAARPVVADLDADGDLDLVAALSATQLRVYFNNGSGSFSTGSTLSLGTSSIASLAAGDVDNDGDVDLLAGTNGAGVTFFNDGTGAFPSTGSFGGALTNLAHLALFDADSDNDIDLVAATTADVFFFTGNATGAFTLVGSVLSAAGISGVNAGDLDGDGDLDLIATCGGTDPRNRALTWTGGTFTNARIIDSVGFPTGVGDLADIDGDGDIDLGCANGSSGLHICPNSWPAYPVSSSPTQYASSVATNANITATFMQNMAGAGSSNFVVRSVGSGHRARGPLSGAYTGAGTSTLGFDPGSDFRRNEELEITLTRGLQTTGSVPIPQPYTWRFRAAAGAGPAVFSAQSIDANCPVGPVNVARTADVDGDGDTDLVCATSSGICFMLNDGAGGFSWITGIAGSGSITDMIADDFDLDGDLDLALYGTTPTSALRIYINYGGNFVQTETIGGSGSYGCADLNGDGAPDLVVTGNVYLNNGSGSFTWTGAQRTYHTTPTGGRVAVADFDKDGDMDIALCFAASASSSSFVYLNDSTGRFPTRAVFGSLSFGGAPYVADLNNDGWPDLLIGNSSASPAAVGLNTGGSFNSYFGSFNGIGGGGSSAQLCVADLDGDGDLDITAGGNGASYVFLNSGTGGFSSGGVFGVISGSTSTLAAFDIDNDGDLDLYMSRSGGSRIHYNASAPAPVITGFNPPSGASTCAPGSNVEVLFNRDMQQPVNRYYMPSYSSQHGSFTSFAMLSGSAKVTVSGLGALPGEEQQITVTTSLIDHTGAALATPYVYLRRMGALGPGGIQFGTSINFGAASDASTCALFLDYDRDGDRDLLIGRFGGPNTLYRNMGSGNFVSQMTVGTGTDNTRALAAGDFNQDGYLDVVVCNQGQSYVYMGAASNPYTTASTLGGATDDIRAAAVGDFTGAGNQQVAVARFGGQDGVFQWGSAACGLVIPLGSAISNSLSVALSDFNRDGRLDLVFGYDGAAKQVFVNGASGFAAPVTLGAATITRSIAAADLNGDHYADVVCANDGPDEIYLNDGSGSFLAPSTFGGNTNSTSVALCELDGDGDLDVVVARSGAQGAVYRNTAGTLGTAVNLGPAAAAGTGVAVADTNGDQRLEILLTLNGGQSALHFNDFAYDLDAVLSDGPMTEPTSFTSLALSASYQNVLDFTLTDGGSSDGLPLLVSKVTLSVPQGLTSALAATFKLTGPGVPGVLANQSSGVVFENLNISVPDGTAATFTVSMLLATPSTMPEASIWQFALSPSSFTVAAHGTHFAAAGGSAGNGSGMTFSVAATQLRCSTQPQALQYRELPFDAAVTYTDIHGNRDYDVTDTVTLTRSDSGTILSQSTAAANAGVASFSFATGRAVRLGTPNAAALRLHFADDASGVTASPCDSNAFDLLDPHTWLGTVSADWNLAANWSANAVPGATSFAFIPSGTPNAPAITANTTVGAIYIASGAALSVSGSGPTLTIVNTLTVAGALTAGGTATLALNPLAKFGGGGTITLANLTSAGATLAANVSVTGNITGTGALSGSNCLVTLAGLTAQTISIAVQPAIRVSNTSATVTFNTMAARTSTATLQIDTGAVAAIDNLTLGAASFTNNGTLVISGNLEPATNPMGVVNVKAASQATLLSWVAANAGTLTVPTGALLQTDGNCDLSATTLIQGGTLRLMSTSATLPTRTVVPPAGNIGVLQTQTNIAANVLVINGNVSCTSLEVSGGSGAVNLNGNLTMTGNLTSTSQAGSSVNISQTLTVNAASPASIDMVQTTLSINRLLVGGTATVTLNRTVKLLSTGTGASSALEVSSGATLLLAAGARVELGGAAAGTAQVSGTLRAALANLAPAVLAGQASTAAFGQMNVEATGVIDLTGVTFENFGATTQSYGIVFNAGCTITAFSRIRIEGTNSNTAAIRLAAANRPATFDRFYINGNAPKNIDGTGLSGAQLLVRSLGLTGNLFGAAHEIDPAARIDWDDVPYVTGTSPAAHSINNPVSTNSAATFSEAMQAPAAGEIAAFGRFGGKLAVALSGGGTPTLTLDPVSNLRVGEKVQVVFRSALKDTSGSALSASAVVELTTAVAASSGVSTASALVGSTLTQAWSVALGDFDLDGDLDFATFSDLLGAGSASSSIFLNDGLGNYVFQANFLTEQARMGLAADLNGDGRLDLVAGRGGSNTGFRVFLNGAGSFGPFADFMVGFQPSAMALGDLDGDGDQDILCQFVGGSISNRIYWNNGSGDFGAAPVLLGPSDYSGATIADFDGDYDLDVICGNRLFRNNGDATFAAGAIWATMNNTTGANAVGDIDADGDADVVHFSGSTDILYLNDGTGVFTAGQQVGTTDVNDWAELVDLDGDGDLDLLTGGTQGALGFVKRMMFSGGAFGAPVTDYAGATTKCHGAATGDIDGDGDLDAVLAQDAGQTILLYNDGQTVLPPDLVSLNPAANSNSLAPSANLTATFNKVLASPQSSALIARGSYRGKLAGVVSINGAIVSFDPASNFAPGEEIEVVIPPGLVPQSGPTQTRGYTWRVRAIAPHTGIVDYSAFNTDVGLGNEDTRAVAVGDFDLDGDIDIALGNYAQQNRVWFNDGTGNFATSVTFGGAATQTRALEACDVDNDGDLDLLVGNYGQPSEVCVNNGSGSFATSGTFGTGTDPTVAMDHGDVDNDGDEDVLLGNAGGQSAIYYNNGSGAFAAPENVGSAAFDCSAVALGDINNDRRLDLVLGAASGQTLVFFRNLGSGQLVQNQAISINITCAVFADFDNDGDLDLVCNGIQVNDGTGYFGTTSPGIGGVYVAVGDLNNDGFLDGASCANGAALAQNLSTASAQPFSVSFGPTSPPHDGRAIALADFDGDGDLDVVIGNAINQPSRVYFNKPASPYVQSTTPDDQSSDVASSTTVKVLCNVAMQPATSSTLPVFSNLRGRLQGVYTQTTNNREFVFTPSQPLLPGEQISMSMPSALKRVEGTPLQYALNASFHVKPALGPANFGSTALGFAASNNAASLVLGDFDGDGDIDAVVGTAGGQDDRLYSNDGSGTLTSTSVVHTGGDTRGACAGDFDGDGDLDVVLVLFNGQSVVLFNNGSAAFSSSNLGATSLPATSVACADLDCDADLDLVVGLYGQQNLVYYNNGSGQFPTSVAVGNAGTNTTSVCVSTNYFRDRPAIFFGNEGQANEALVWSRAISGYNVLNFGTGSDATLALACGDFASDFDADPVVANGSGQANTVCPLTGSFGAPVNVGTSGRDSYAACVGDFDGDGDLDIAIGNDGSGQGEVLLNNGGAFTVGSALGAAANTRAIASADMDGDGDIDIVAAGLGQSHVLLNGGTAPQLVSTSPPLHSSNAAMTSNCSATFNTPMGAPSAATFRLFASGRLVSGAYGGGGTTTLNLDPSLDFRAGEQVSFVLTATTSGSGGGQLNHGMVVSFMARPGASPATFALRGIPVSLASMPIGSIAGGDLDGDGDMDFIGTRSSAGMPLVFTQAAGLLSSGGTLGQTGYDYFSAALADVDGDSDLDVLLFGRVFVSGSYRWDIDVFTNNGLVFTHVANLPDVLEIPQIGDLDADGDLDLCFVRNGAAVVAFNNGGGTFPVTATYALGGGGVINRVRLADVNNDYSLDIVPRTNQVTGTNLFLNNGAGLFTGVVPSGFAGQGADFIADFNGDGKLDIGYGTMVSSDTFGAGGTVVSLGATNNIVGYFDADGDGDLDLLVDVNSGQWRVFTNQGGFVFVPGALVAENWLGATPPVFTDYDGDGDVDVVACNGLFRVFRNTDEPFVVATSPESLAGQAASGDLSSTFSLPMNPATIAGTLAARGFHSGLHTGTLNLATGNTVLTLDPGTDFVAGEWVEAVLQSGPQSAAGKPLAAPFVWRFRVASAAAAGTFGQPSPVAAVLDGRQCVAGDFDNDGDIDVAFVDEGGQDRLLLNNGAGVFSGVINIGPAASPTRYIGAADLNGDGALDLLTSETAGNALTPWFNSGLVFTAQAPLAAAGPFVTADFDGDGDVDIATAAAVFLNAGNGTFPTNLALTPPPGLSLAGPLCVLDTDGDGRLDIAAASGGGTRRVVTFLNVGAGFAAIATSADLGADVLALVAIKWNTDRFDDLVVGTTAGGQILQGNGYGAMAAAATWGSTAQSYSDVQVNDLDGDGDDDLFATGSLPQVLHRNGSTFSAIVSLPAGTRHAAILDLDGNGELDAAVVTAGQVLTIFNGGPDADGTLGASAQALVLDSVQAAQQFTTLTTLQITDGGGPDSLPLAFASLTVSVSGGADATDALWLISGPGAVDIPGVANAGQVTFSGLSISIASGTNAQYQIKARLKGKLSGTEEGEAFILSVNASSFGGLSGTLFNPVAAAQSGACTLSVVYTGLRFAVSPGGAAVSAPFSVQPQVAATDPYGNRDQGAGGLVYIAAFTSLPGASVPVFGNRSASMTNGLAVFTGLSIDVIGSGYFLRASSAYLTALSDAFDVSGQSAVAQPPFFFRLEVADPDDAYKAGDSVTVRAYLAQTGLSLVADFSALDSALGSAVAMTDLGTGWYEITSAALVQATMIEGALRAITVVATNGASLSASRVLNVRIDKTAPILNLGFNQEPGAIGIGTFKITLTANEALSPAPLVSIAGLSIQLDRTSVAMQGTSPAASWTYELNIPSGLVATGSFSVLTATDRAGNAAAVMPSQTLVVTGSGAGLVASAGADLLIDQPQRVPLSSLGSQGGTSLNWTQLSGPFVSLSSTTAAQPSFFARLPGEYVFRLDIVAGAAVVSDFVTVRLENSAPVVDAGLDRNLETNATYTVGATRYLDLPLRGHAFDENGESLQLTWRLAASPPNGNLRIQAQGASTTALEVVGTAVVPGVYIFALQANDTGGLAPGCFVSEQVRVVVVSPTVIPPAAHAGFDQVVSVGVPVQLSGNESADPDGATPHTLSYHWVIESAPSGSSAAFTDDSVKNPSFTADMAGNYIIALIVTDASSMSSGLARIRIVANSIANTVPRGVIGVSHSDLDSNGSMNVLEPITLSGAASVDGQGDPIVLRWSQIAGPATVNLDDPRGVAQTFTPLVPGNYAFSLQVWDPSALGIPAVVRISVCAAGFVAPVPMAALDVQDDPNTDGYVLVIPGVGVDNNPANPDVDVSGAQSTASTGLSLTYEWTQVRGPTVAVSGARSAAMSFVPIISRVYEFVLRIEDSNGIYRELLFVMAIDTWHQTINPTGNAVPRAASGPPVTVGTGQQAVLSGTAYDPNNSTGLLFYWVQAGGAPVVLNTTTPLTPSFVAPIAGTYTFFLYVDDGQDISPPVLVTVQASGTPPPPPAGGGGNGGNDDGGCSTHEGPIRLAGWALLALLAIAMRERLRRVTRNT